MIDFLWQKLSAFRNCFSRTAAYRWFVIIIIGLMTRSDQLGVSSFIRSLSLKTGSYELLIHFFRSKAYHLTEIRTTWYSILKQSGLLLTTDDGRVFLYGDGTKVPKEGKHMPGVKKHHQESEDISKPAYIFGHMFGGLAAAIGNKNRYYACPLRFEIHDGLAVTASWQGQEDPVDESHVVRMISNAYDAAGYLGKSLLTLDRYFLTVPALKRLDERNAGEHLLDIVTRAKNNCTAFEEPAVPEKPKRGGPRKRGASVKLKELFKSRDAEFTEAKVCMYGKEQDIRYLCLDLLWGNSIYKKLRFVLVQGDEFGRSIFVSTDLELSPVSIIEAYARRFHIETLFREYKQQIGGFSYHFWSKCMPKLKRFRKKTDPDPLESVTDEKEQTNLIGTINAMHVFVMLSCIAIGLAQMMALTPEIAKIVGKDRYLRTQPKEGVSEATVLDYLRKHFYRLLLLNPVSDITQIILTAVRDDFGDTESEKAA